ncbi:LysR family positive regulator for ilvC [Volucribacter psittacicida]|uniref:LysR family positive regulator for ilvC n=1 Tax=Volucribacter psittacicida TaxID=203482 RepID=A0A4R1G596_9PAST|nr:HTH-type transcriptional activator IlvY [Volucribacter psittacicida]TCJ98881.1 LysR family positive regulator for ilvC [Volucribacter psittacicida]
MDFKDLKLFLHLAENKNFSKTANQYFMSASTLSRQIQRMEQELGKPLFFRDNRQVALTETGERFIPFAQQQWQQWQQFKQSLSINPQQLTGELRIYCSVTAAYSHLPNILERFRQHYPKVEIKLTTGDPALALHYIDREQADLALTGKPQQLPSHIQFQVIDHLTMAMIAPRIACLSTQLLQQKPIDWQTIPFILPMEGPVRQRIDQWFRQHKIKHPKIYATVAGHEGIVPMVALGCGVALLPEVVIKHSPMNSQVSLLNLDLAVEPLSLGICSQKRHLSHPLVQAFWQIL